MKPTFSVRNISSRLRTKPRGSSLQERSRSMDSSSVCTLALVVRCTLHVMISISPELVMSVQDKFSFGTATLTWERMAPDKGFALRIDKLVAFPLLATRMSSSIANRSESTYTIPFTIPRAALAAVKTRRLLWAAWLTNRTAYEMLLYKALARMRYACIPATLLSSSPPAIKVSGPDGSTARAFTS